MTSAIAIIGSVGCALGAAYIGKTIAGTFRDMQRLSKLTKGSPFTYYYRGGFESKMSRREASLILNVRDYFSKNSIRDAHRRIMLLNHPDRGGSPFIASKINEAKALLEKDLSD